MGRVSVQKILFIKLFARKMITLQPILYGGRVLMAVFNNQGFSDDRATG
jgi:hypothetical protein